MTTSGKGAQVPAQLHAHDWIILPLLSFLSALLLGAICTSLYYSYAAAGAKGADASMWQLLNAVGGFWNGHFGALTLVAVAWGLYFQMKALRDESHASRERAIEAESHMRHWMLSQLDARRRELARWLKSSVAWQDEVGRWRLTKAAGLEVISNALGTFLHKTNGGYCLVHITTSDLQEYATALRTSIGLIEECDEEEGTRLRAMFDVSHELTLIDSFLAAFDELRNSQRDAYDRCAADAASPEVLQQFNDAVSRGWTFDVRDFGGTSVIDAKSLSLDGELLECQRVAPVAPGGSLLAELRQLLASIEGRHFERRRLET